MKVLVDECVDWRILRDLDAHDARTVKQFGWKGGDDGSLLAKAAAEFDVFLTVDTKLPGQQNIVAMDIAVVVLRGRQYSFRVTRLPDTFTFHGREISLRVTPTSEEFVSPNLQPKV
jgi:predicted nuclease of predicted toxin-antitoxin system